MCCLYCSPSLYGNLLGHCFPAHGLVSGSVVLSHHRTRGSSACVGGPGPVFFLRSPTQGEPRARLSWSSLQSAGICEPGSPLAPKVICPRGSWKREPHICRGAQAPRVATRRFRTSKGFLDFYFYAEKIHGDREGELEINKINLFWKTADIICTCGKQNS